jgi:hypothetical protein
MPDRSTTDEATFAHDEHAQDADLLWNTSLAFRAQFLSWSLAVRAYQRASDRQRARWVAEAENTTVECVLARFEANQRLAELADF